MKTEDMDLLLHDWAKLNVQLMQLDENAVMALLEREKAAKARLRVMLRLYHRWSKLRGTREKAELARGTRG